ncbi:Protein LURP-one-related 6 [Acorus calamus]|uniref:Protein LURP-one-related 6 n=1 Tax=Acorus calamus TaxID=4465 RepID=A0AAV9ELF6_ACOCL|nr:Protein LURP-one-related 6 [Acorus calamus]
MGVEKMIISKLFCSSSRALLIVRKRPRVVNGGGFVVTTNNDQKVVFTVDGCGTIGLKGELIVRDGDGEPILFIRKRGGIVEALSIQKQWKGFRVDYEGAGKLVFTLRESVSSCIAMNDSIKVCMELNKHNRSSDWDYEVRGSFIDRDCTINDRKGDVVAQVMWGTKESKTLEQRESLFLEDRNRARIKKSSSEPL